MVQGPRVRRSIPSMCDLKQKDFVKNMILSKNKDSFLQIELQGNKLSENTNRAI